MITGIIMASGYSRRMGTNKLLLDFQGKKIIEYVIEAAKNSDLDKLILIYRDEAIGKLAADYGLKTIYNNKAHLGQSQSVILGVGGAPQGSYMFLVGDQPFISSSLINQLIAKHREDRSKIVIPRYGEKIAMPIIFPGDFREDLLKVKGDKGGREIVKNNPRLVENIIIEDRKSLIDIDNIQDYKYWNSSHF